MKKLSFVLGTFVLLIPIYSICQSDQVTADNSKIRMSVGLLEVTACVSFHL